MYSIYICLAFFCIYIFKCSSTYSTFWILNVSINAIIKNNWLRFLLIFKWILFFFMVVNSDRYCMRVIEYLMILKIIPITDFKYREKISLEMRWISYVNLCKIFVASAIADGKQAHLHGKMSMSIWNKIQYYLKTFTLTKFNSITVFHFHSILSLQFI